MASRHIPILFCLSAALVGCAHNPTHGDGHSRNGPEGPHAHGSDRVIEAPLPIPAAASWGETAVHPVMPKGPRAVADIDGPYLLDTGDRLRIFVYGQPNLSRIYPVDHSGRITVPLIGRVRARGRTTRRMEGVIRYRLGTRFVKDPQVTVDIAQNRPFFILGEVRTAGQYPYVSGITVQSAVAIAGGFSERADQKRVWITRRINGFVEKMLVPLDYVIKPGDTINVRERFL